MTKQTKAHVRNEQMEMTTLATVLDININIKVRKRMYALLRPELFGSQLTQPLYACIEARRKETRELTDARVLGTDPRTPQSIRDTLGQLGSKRWQNVTQFEDAVRTLTSWASKRAVLRGCNKLTDVLEAGAYDEEQAIELLRDMLRRVQRPSGMQTLVLDPRAPELKQQVAGLLSAAKAHNSKRWPTGWPTLDAVMGGGLGPLDVLLMAANTGGGKSMAALAVAMHMVEKGANVCYFAFEMTQVSMALRLLAKHAGPTRGELAKGTMTPREAEEAANSFALYYSQYAGKLRILTPELGFARPSVDYLEGVIQQEATDVVVVDYLAMLTDPALRAANDEVRLRTMTADLKMLAAATQVGVIALAQLNEEGNDIKHSKGAKDACDYVVTWSSKGANNVEESYLVNILKKREQPGPSADTFWLTQDYDHLKIYEPAVAPTAQAQTSVIKDVYNQYSRA